MKWLIAFLPILALAQQGLNDSDIDRMFDQIRQRMEQQERMMQDFFRDDPFFSDGFGDHMQPMGGDFSYAIERDEKKVRVLIQLPSEDTQPEVEVSEKGIKLQGEFTVKEEKKTEYGSSFSSSTSIVNKLIPLPRDADPDKVDIRKDDKELIVEFRKLDVQSFPKAPKKKAPQKTPLKIKKKSKRTI
jgi:HSP20 family molecular chaperone IbpA